jgi:hypothetical protein
MWHAFRFHGEERREAILFLFDGISPVPHPVHLFTTVMKIPIRLTL